VSQDLDEFYFFPLSRAVLHASNLEVMPVRLFDNVPFLHVIT